MTNAYIKLLAVKKLLENLFLWKFSSKNAKLGRKTSIFKHSRAKLKFKAHIISSVWNLQQLVGILSQICSVSKNCNFLPGHFCNPQCRWHRHAKAADLIIYTKHWTKGKLTHQEGCWAVACIKFSKVIQLTCAYVWIVLCLYVIAVPKIFWMYVFLGGPPVSWSFGQIYPN